MEIIETKADPAATARHLPDWLPFMERLRYARTWRSAIENLTKLPFEASLKAMVQSLISCDFMLLFNP
jgi:hypothetical protein